LIIFLLFVLSGEALFPQESPTGGKTLPGDPESGPRSVLAVCRYFGIDSTVEELHRLSGMSGKGATIVELSNAARRKNLAAAIVKMSIEKVAALKSPFIIQTAEYHFLPVEPFRKGRFRVIDPAAKPYYITRDELSQMWNGNALVISRKKSPESKEPDIIFSEYFFDFGTIEQDETLSHVFKFKNRGGKKLVITRLRSTCGCMAALLSEKEIPPGGSGQVELKLESGRRRGPQKFRAYVTSNDADEPIVGLTLVGIVKADFVITPRRINFGSIRKGEGAIKRITLLEGEHKIRIAGVDFTSQFLFAEVFPIRRGDNAGYEVIVALSPQAPAGALEEKVTIVIENARKEKIEIPIYGKIQGQIVLSPESLFFGFVKRGTSLTRRVTISNNTEEELNLESVEYPENYFSLRVILSEKAKEFVIEAVLKKDAPPGKVDESVRVHTSSKNHPIIEIPVYAVIESDK